MKLTLQLVKTPETFRLIAITKTDNELDIDHVKFVDLDKDVFTSAFLMGHAFDVEFEGLEGVIATQEAIAAVKAQQEAAAAAKAQEEAVEVVEAEVVAVEA